MFLLTPLIAEETQPTEPPETAREVTTPKKEGYYYGIIKVPPDFIARLLSDEKLQDNQQGGSPFDDVDTETKINFNELAPTIPIGQLPLCLPAHISNYNLAKVFPHFYGVEKPEKEWLILSGGLAGDGSLHYCLSVDNAEILLDIFTPLCCGAPRNISYHSTLVSVPDPGFTDNKPWTMNRLTKLQPTIHAKHGILSRSGEKSLIQFNEQIHQLASFSEIAPVIGEDGKHADIRVSLDHQLHSKNTPIRYLSAHTLPTNTPYICDLGIHGEDQRNYLLIQNIKPVELHRHSHYRQHIDKIEGIYAMRKPGQQTEEPPKLEDYRIQAYRCHFDLINQLRSNLYEMHTDEKGESPFDNQATTSLTPPIRIKNYTPNQYLGHNDIIYDITFQLNTIGIRNHGNKRALFNQSNSTLIIQGSLSYRAAIINFLEAHRPTIRMVRVKARLIEVDSTSLQPVDWNLKEIKKRNPKTLKMYAVTSRSGEMSSLGKSMTQPEKTPLASSVKSTRKYSEFEIEPTLAESNFSIDLRVSIHNPELILKTALTVEDGKPMIIELGHPDSADRTNILLLHTDIITPSGHFFRSAIEPLDQ